jgi:hypothetical protein
MLASATPGVEPANYSACCASVLGLAWAITLDLYGELLDAVIPGSIARPVNSAHGSGENLFLREVS